MGPQGKPTGTRVSPEGLLTTESRAASLSKRSSQLVRRRPRRTPDLAVAYVEDTVPMDEGPIVGRPHLVLRERRPQGPRATQLGVVRRLLAVDFEQVQP